MFSNDAHFARLVKRHVDADFAVCIRDRIVNCREETILWHLIIESARFQRIAHVAFESGEEQLVEIYM